VIDGLRVDYVGVCLVDADSLLVADPEQCSEDVVGIVACGRVSSESGGKGDDTDGSGEEQGAYGGGDSSDFHGWLLGGQVSDWFDL
jgi:hypothetical protein